MIRRRARLCRVPPAIIEGRSYLTCALNAPHATMSLSHLKHETKSHLTKIKTKMCAYKVRVIKDLAKILNMVLSPELHTHVHTRAHTRTWTRIHMCDTWRSHMSPRDALFPLASLRLPRQHTKNKNIILLNLNQINRF